MLSFIYMYGLSPIGETGAADLACKPVATAGGAVFSSIGNDLKVQVVPVVGMVQFFEIDFGLNYVFSRG